MEAGKLNFFLFSKVFFEINWFYVGLEIFMHPLAISEMPAMTGELFFSESVWGRCAQRC